MLVTYIGHAGLRVETANVSMLMDPWLSSFGAFLGSWHQFPSNQHLDSPPILDTDWVTVSHEHLDHMDTSVLTRLPARTRVLIPAYQSPNLRNRLVRAGVANVIEIPAWKRFELNTAGDWVTFIPEESPMCQDAAVLLCAGDSSLLNVNDARLTVPQARRAAFEAGGHLDVMAMQASGASWHPICYEYPPEVMRRISADKRLGKLKAVARLIRAARPGLAVPFAGPPCFLDPTLRQHNVWIPEPGIFPDMRQAADWLQERLSGYRVAHWLPGDEFDVPSGVHVRSSKLEAFSYDEIEAYLQTYADQRRPQIDAVWAANPEPDEGLGERFEDHFRRLGEISPSYFLARIGMTVRFEVEGPGGGRWDVHFGPEGVEVDLRGRSSEVQYRFSVLSRWLAPVVDEQIGWEDLLLSLRFSAWRQPDIYNDYLVGLLKHAEPNVLAAVEEYETGRNLEETVIVHGSGGSYEVSRYCPHAGEDLKEGSILVDGVLRCLGHNFEFDLSTGQCLNARCEPIRARRVGQPEHTQQVGMETEAS